MATTEQRDKKIVAAQKKIDTATKKRDKAQVDYNAALAELTKAEEHMAWVKAMPVSDGPETPAEPAPEPEPAAPEQQPFSSAAV